MPQIGTALAAASTSAESMLLSPDSTMQRAQAFKTPPVRLLSHPEIQVQEVSSESQLLSPVSCGLHFEMAFSVATRVSTNP